MQRRRITYVIFLLCLLLCPSCDERNTFQSSVPRYPVNITIDTRSGVFVHFIPSALNTYVWIDEEGYHYNGQIVQRSVLDAIGYGGVVVYIDINGQYNAFDLACPYCAGRGRRMPCLMDGIHAVCPECGEHYDVGSGTAAPQQGIAKEGMLRLPLNNNGGQLTIRQ